ncbi:putative efflux protein MATE family [Clostridium sp. CAG:417]|nr:putative efflux protein MATE family [Clostridium sp. CAG:417]
MKDESQNKMAIEPINKLILKMGLPMIVSMVLQALYNVIDSIFVANMGSTGAIANQALTYAFPIQIMIIAIGVGTGVGLNALLSKSLGENDKNKVNKIAGNGIFLSICIYIFFLIFGLFFSKWFISLFTNDKEIIKMGTTYLKICTCLSLGSIGYTVYERFLQATGETMLSTISQISGAVTNIVLDYIFIYPLDMGVAGAAWATIIGQFVSLFIAMYFHYNKNKEIDGSLKYINPDGGIIKAIYSIGVSAALMQTLLAVMMAGMNAILGLAQVDQTVLIGSFGIYYKIQQIALFSAFGLSNTIISILSFNYGMQDRKRIDDCIKYGIMDTMIVTLIISILFEVFAYPLANLFGLAGGETKEIIKVCTIALRISSIGFIFMGISVAIQGILQSIRYALRPLIISLLRLVIFVFPVALLFTKSSDVVKIVWWTFPIAEVLTSIIALLILKDSYNRKIKMIKNKMGNNNYSSGKI